MSIFKDKVLLISGGTGSFGNAVLKRFLRTDIKEIRIFSRDEKKQDDMRRKKLRIMSFRNPRDRFYFPCGRPQAGALLRVFPHGKGRIAS